MSKITVAPTAPTVLSDWRRLVVDQRADLLASARTVTVDQDTDGPSSWLEIPRPNPALEINAVHDLASKTWKVVAGVQDVLSADDALAASVALSTAARQVDTLNAREMFSIPTSHVGREIAGKIGSVVSLVATEYEAGVALHIDLGAYADRCTAPGARWSWADEDSDSTMWFEYIGEYRVVGLDVHDAFSPRVILADTEVAL
ncbi:MULTISPECIES: hypothetical protein [unclassified Rathayibacter]|uniref:hypothetical protein n=1 Tax=unclassified Rathayibacter TaxID=2609250 RepID=UPI001051B517|nr:MULTISPECIES: hypothetical protein [unclassified Rathayibacter]TCL84803.1 hypothetical protein EDF49_102476 [Rathayibacter sp. PhB192]TCM30521.1 hypothetical protein EDF43_102476 [Rathayibacter sp. PhB179]